MLGAAYQGSRLYEALARRALHRGTAVEWIEDEGLCEVGGVKLVVRGPGPCPCSSINDKGLVVWARGGSQTALLPGDIQACRERCMLERGNVARSDILIAPHHGSTNSMPLEFLGAVHPQWVVISKAPSALSTEEQEEAARPLSSMGAVLLWVEREGSIALPMR